jgi:hypothetical protein
MTNLLLAAGWLIGTAQAENQEDQPATSPVPTQLDLRLASSARGWGVGIAAGEPSGVAIALRPNDRSTFAGVIGWSLSASRLHVHTDYQITIARVQPDPALDVMLDFFVGAGASLDLGEWAGNTPTVAVRIPLGVSMNFGEKPLDLYLELVPLMGLVPDTRTDLEGGVGLRVWFD